MRRMLALAALVTLTACGPASTVTGDVGSPTPGDPTATASAAASGVVEGVLDGDPRLEGGCVWLETDAGRVEVLWPDGYRATAEPVELRNPAGTVVASRGDRVRVPGTEATDRVTVCQVGRIWIATEVTRLP